MGSEIDYMAFQICRDGRILLPGFGSIGGIDDAEAGRVLRYIVCFHRALQGHFLWIDRVDDHANGPVVMRFFGY